MKNRNRKTPRFQSDDKRNKADLLERLKSYPLLRLRKKQQLYIIDSKEYEGFNVAGFGSISELHTSLDLKEKDPIFIKNYKK
jgi:hypothetical protein